MSTRNSNCSRQSPPQSPQKRGSARFSGTIESSIAGRESGRPANAFGESLFELPPKLARGSLQPSEHRRRGVQLRQLAKRLLPFIGRSSARSTKSKRRSTTRAIKSRRSWGSMRRDGINGQRAAIAHLGGARDRQWWPGDRHNKGNIQVTNFAAPGQGIVTAADVEIGYHEAAGRSSTSP